MALSVGAFMRASLSVGRQDDASVGGHAALSDALKEVCVCSIDSVSKLDVLAEGP